jgi:hypothetical protein
VAVITSSAAHAASVPLDMSGVFNYDAVVTATETNNNAYAAISGGGIVNYIPANHAITGGANDSRAYTTQGSLTAVGSAATGIADTGVVAGLDRNYQLSTNWDNGIAYRESGAAAVPNALRLNQIGGASDGTVTSVTITLPGAQQQAYENLNVLGVSTRSNNGATWRTFIEATYSDASTSVVWETTFANTTINEPGGTFGSAGIYSQGGFGNATDSNTAFRNALSMTGQGRTTGSTTQRTIVAQDGTLTANLWELSTPADLDSTKTLVSLTFGVDLTGSTNTNRNMTWFIFGTTLEPVVPEPTSLAVLALGAGAMLRRRRA